MNILPELIQNISFIIKSLNNDLKLYNKKNVLNKLLDIQLINNINVLNTRNCNGKNNDCCFLFKNEIIFNISTKNEEMCPIKQDYYFQIKDKYMYTNNMPFIFIYQKHIYMVVFNINGDVVEYYKTFQTIPLPEENYVVLNGTTFVNYNNNNTLQFRLISETYEYSLKDQERDYNIQEVPALNILTQLKLANF